MKRMVLFVVLVAPLIVGCRPSRPSQGAIVPSVPARDDSVDILEAVWRAAASRYDGLRAVWFYLPSQTEPGMVTTSADIQAELAGRGIPASPRLPVGDDTVVFRVARWQSATSSTSLLQIDSRWTTGRTTSAGRCRTGFANTEWIQAARTVSGWTAVRTGPVRHGELCVPVP